MGERRIRIEGYYTPDSEELDESSPIGLTEEAYINVIQNEDGYSGLRLADLEDIELELE